MATLGELAEKYGTDKRPSEHNYTPMYEKLFKTIDINSLLEIGLGTGASLRMWIDYLPDAKIYCIEDFGVENKEKWGSADGNIPGLNLVSGDSTLDDTWKKVPYYLDVIVDDGDHHPDAQWATFSLGFQHLRTGGLYFIEDTHCNWTELYTGGQDLMYGKVFDWITGQQTPQANWGGNFYLARPWMPISSRDIYSYHFYKSIIAFEKA